MCTKHKVSIHRTLFYFTLLSSKLFFQLTKFSIQHFPFSSFFFFFPRGIYDANDNFQSKNGRWSAPTNKWQLQVSGSASCKLPRDCSNWDYKGILQAIRHHTIHILDVIFSLSFAYISWPDLTNDFRELRLPNDLKSLQNFSFPEEFITTGSIHQCC